MTLEAVLTYYKWTSVEGMDSQFKITSQHGSERGLGGILRSYSVCRSDRIQAVRV